MLGLKRGTAELIPHQPIQDENAETTIVLLKNILVEFAVDIQHIGSTSISGIHAKPIIDIAVGVNSLENTPLYIKKLEQHGIIFRGQDIPEQLLFVMGDFENNIRTHHIHLVKWNTAAWNNYINFRDYLNTFPEKAKIYDKCKQKLAAQFSANRSRYTEGKRELIDILLQEAQNWKTST